METAPLHRCSLSNTKKKVFSQVVVGFSEDAQCRKRARRVDLLNVPRTGNSLASLVLTPTDRKGVPVLSLPFKGLYWDPQVVRQTAGRGGDLADLAGMNKRPGGTGNNSKRSLLGYDDPDGEALAKTAHDQLRAQNEQRLGQLAEGSELLMRTVKDIDIELGLSREQMSR